MPSVSTWSKHIPLLIKKQNGYCYYCGEKVSYHKKCDLKHKSQFASIDHVVPRSANGSNKIENLVVSCRACNNTKGSNSVNEFLYLLNMNDVEFNKYLQKRKVIRVKETIRKDKKRVKKRAPGLFKIFIFLWMHFPELAQELQTAIEANPDSAYYIIGGGAHIERRKEKTPYEVKLKGCRKRRVENFSRLLSQHFTA